MRLAKHIQAILVVLFLAGVACGPSTNTNSGESVYQMYCVSCHGTDGKGNRGYAADFVNDKERMSKSDEELLNSIRDGFRGTMGQMPRWKNKLSEKEIISVLKYIRETFGKSVE